MKRLLLIGIAVLFGTGLLAQTGKIRGKITDDTGFGLPGATVIIEGTIKGASTDLDGNYTLLGLEPGTYNLKFEFVSFSDQIIEAIVKADEVTVVNAMMSNDVQITSEAVVVGRANNRSDNAMVEMTKRSSKVENRTGAAEMKRNGDTQVAQAAKRVTGVTIEGGKYVYVRGLSDRYSKTLLNGAEIPGLDPNRNSVQLDMFPTSLVENIAISKSFTPDVPGSFTGGLINITTKDFPDSLVYNVNLSIGYNTQCTFASNYFGYEGGKLDWLGMDDGSRALPDVIANSEIQGTQGGDLNLLTSQTRSFSQIWNVEDKMAIPNTSFSFSVGNQIDLKEESDNPKQLGFNAAITYRRNLSLYTNGTMGRYQLTGDYDDSNELITQSIFRDERSDENVLLGGLVNINLKLNKKNKLGFVLLRNQGGVSSARYQIGQIPNVDPDLVKEQISLRYLEREMTTAQLKGEHTPRPGGLRIDWIASFTSSGQETPDLRTFDSDYQVNNDGSLTYHLNEAAYPAPNRFYRDMSETNIDTKINVTLPLGIGMDTTVSTLKFGASNVMKNRDFSERRYEFGRINIQYEGDIEAFFSDENMDATSNSFIFVEDLTDLRNTYEAEERVTAGYAMLDYMPWERIRVAAGARAESAFIQATSLRFFEFTDEIEQAKYRGTLDNLDILPSLNVTFKANDSTNFRVAYTRTLARPAFRELAPFASFDFATRYTKIGNPGLERTLVDNIDLRYEIYPRLGELVTIGAFYKNFTSPIELVINPQAANVELTWQNQEYARVYGAEFEAKKSLSFISGRLDNWSGGFNVTYVYSETKINEAELAEIRSTDPNHADTRQMFGQSPYIVNTFLNYKNDTTGLSLNLTYNVSGPKMALVVGGGTPNVFDQPRHSLNIALGKKITENFQVRLRGRNLLNAEYAQTYEFKGEQYDFQRYAVGRTVSISASLNF